MLVRYCWPSCDYWKKKWGASPIDAFWVEATQEEAIQSVFPLLSQEARLESEELASQSASLAAQISQPLRPFCFLVARDLSTIDPFVVHYPFHHMWNAYSPFRSIPERTISCLDQLSDV